MKEVMLPMCSPGYLGRPMHRENRPKDAPSSGWPTRPKTGCWNIRVALTSASGAAKALSFSDYAVVVQAALLGQGVTLGWITVVSHWLLTGALVPASAELVTTRRVCEFVTPRNRPIRPVAVGDQGLDHRANAQRHRRDRQTLSEARRDGRLLLSGALEPSRIAMESKQSKFFLENSVVLTRSQ